MPYDGYVRVSRVGGRRGAAFMSPDVQREQIEAWAKLRGVTIAEVHTDLDQSGSKLKRPALDQAIARVETGVSEGIVVAKIDRFARSLTGALETIARVERAGGTFVSVAEGIDPTTPAGKLMQRLMLSLAEFELDRIREQWATARERAVERGVHIASRCPTGYQRRHDGTLEPHPTWGPVIGRLFALRAAGGSWRELADLLDREGVVGPYGAVHWTTRAVDHLIHNRVYLGEARSGRHVNPTAHQPLVDRTTWEAAQRSRGVSVPQSREPYVLAGLLRCAGCRYLLKPDRMTQRGQWLRMYRCRGNHAAGRCPDRAAVLERVILPYVEERFLELAKGLVADIRDRDIHVGGLEQAARDAETELVAYRDQRIADILGDRYLEGLEQRAIRANRAREELGQAHVGPAVHAGLPEVWPTLEVAEKQKLLLGAWDCVVLRSGRTRTIQDRTLFIARGNGPDNLPRRGVRVPLKPFVWPEGDLPAGKPGL